MPAPAIDNALLPAIRPNAPAPNASHAESHSFRAALAAQTDQCAPRASDPERPVEQTKAARPDVDNARADDAPAHDDAPKDDDTARTEDSDEAARVSQAAASDTEADAPATSSGPKSDLSALAAMLAQILMAPAQALAHISGAPAAAVLAPAAAVVALVSDAPPADPNANAADQPSSGDQTASPTAADPNAVLAAPMAVAQPAPPAAAVAAPAPPQPDAPAPAESTSAPATTSKAGQPHPAAPIAEPAPIQPAETQTAQSVPTQPNDVADAPAPDQPREGARPAADASQANAAPQPARHDAPRPMDHIRAETRSVAVAPAVNQIAIHVSRAVKDGVDKFDIDLKPETLGRVTVRLEFTSDTRVQAVFAVERPETLELLKRDAGEIARSLNDAGVRADAGSLSFSLHGNGNGNGGSAERQVAAGQPILFPAADAIPAPAAIVRPNYVGVGSVDIRI